jgi:hypothetical protein
MARYVKKPIIIDAIRITRTNLDEIKDFVNGGDSIAEPMFDNITSPLEKPRLAMFLIHTLEGVMRADVGDWVIKGIRGEFYPIKNSIFIETYEDEEPKEASQNEQKD